MKYFILKILFFFILFLAIVFGVTYYKSLSVLKGKNFQNHNSEECLVITPKNQHFDYLLLGISHARNFSRHNNHKRFEDLLDISMLNYGKGGGNGNIASQHNYLRYFISKGNTTDKILYVLTMPMFFSNRMDSNAFEYEKEIFNLKFLYIILTGPGINKGQKVYNYLRYKYNKRWKKYGHWSAKSKDKTLSEIDSVYITQGLQLAYPNGLDTDVFERNKRYIMKTSQLAQKNGIEISFLITPTVFGKWPGHDEVMLFMSEVERLYGFKTYDFSEVYLGRLDYFYDHHHMNTPGVINFTKEHLLPLVK